MARRRERVSRVRADPSTLHYRRLENPFEPLQVLSDDHVAHIHETAVDYLAEHGIRVLLEEARMIFADAGASVDDEMLVLIDPERISDALASAPATFDLQAPNPERSVAVGGRGLVLAPVGGPPFVSDLRNGRRAGTLADQENFLKLTQTYDVMAVTAPCIEPDDITLAIRHLRSGFATLTLTDKSPFLYARGRRRVRDGFDLVKLRYGIESDEEFAEQPR